MIKTLKRLFFAILFLAIVALVIFLCIVTYVDIQSSEAKEYLVETYELNEKDLKIKKFKEYVYEDIADCDSLWFKKCTSEENLVYKYTFNYEDKKIVVKEYEDGTFVDDYGNGTKVPDMYATNSIQGPEYTTTSDQIMEDILG